MQSVECQTCGQEIEGLTRPSTTAQQPGLLTILVKSIANTSTNAILLIIDTCFADDTMDSSLLKRKLRYLSSQHDIANPVSMFCGQ